MVQHVVRISHSIVHFWRDLRMTHSGVGGLVRLPNVKKGETSIRTTSWNKVLTNRSAQAKLIPPAKIRTAELEAAKLQQAQP